MSTIKFLLISILNFLLLGCADNYHGTKNICGGKLYVEYYCEWSDMGVCYLTDSVKFRVKIDRYNIESEYFKYHCNQDSLLVELWSNYPLPKHILTTKAYFINKLIEEGELGK